MKEINPSIALNKTKEERKRIPMSVPVQRLEAPDMPGFHLHWFRGDAERIQRAVDAGYEFVDPREILVNNVSLGGDSSLSGSTDMGSQVSIVSGQEVGKDGQAMRLILMKQKQEWHEADMKITEARNEQVAAALRGGMIGAQNDRAGDTQHRYVDKARTAIPDLFTPKRPRVA